ncbi:GNAT family N-acetyltransferase [Haloarchaeobius sp. DFWS5]|uniref:GNAT family N-acetyltransferase n=1 Tax=Haloarchaeobius sp. DFWS5 TaxID=3446114 RepID=UPI003EB78078
MEVRELTDETERSEAVPILRQLWSDADPASVLEWTGDDEYSLFGGYVDDALIGVAGVRVTDVLHHSSHAWLYDLVVDESHRAKGYGTELVEFVEQWADERGCEYVILVSPRAKEGIHQYYQNRNYEKWGYVIEKEL